MGKNKYEKEFNEKYGNLTETERNNVVVNSIGAKFAERARAQETAREEMAKKYNLPYGELVKAYNKTATKITELSGKAEEALKAKRAELGKLYDEMVKQENILVQGVNRELWISQKAVEWMGSEGNEYSTYKAELAEAKQDHAIYLSLKEKWEADNADIIEAERMRSVRDELLSADDDTLRALGIEPVKKARASVSLGGGVSSPSSPHLSYSDPNVTTDELVRQALMED